MKRMVNTTTSKYHNQKQRKWKVENRNSHREGVYFQDVLDKVLKSGGSEGDAEVLERLEAIYGKKKRICDIGSKDQQLYALVDKMANARSTSIKKYLQGLGYVYGNGYGFY